MSFRYNDELLLTSEGRRLASEQFPHIAFALNHPGLRAEFKKHDDIANRYKSRTRHWGVCAVSLTAAALFIAAWEPALHNVMPHEGLWKLLPRWIASVAALVGITAAFVSWSGVLYGKSKEAWLHARLVTERIRQWHYQSILSDIPALVAAALSSEARAAYERTRAMRFSEFQQELIDQVVAEFPRYVKPTATGADMSARNLLWLRPEWIKPPATLPDEATPIVEELCSAYEAYRLRGQLQYTSFKLKDENVSFWTHAPVQARVLGAVAFTSGGTIVILHGVMLAGAMIGSDWILNPVVPALAISLAITILAGRVLEEGLQPHREKDRLQMYLLQLETAAARIRTANSIEEKLVAMREVEEASYSEMIGFLKSGYESRFVI